MRSVIFAYFFLSQFTTASAQIISSSLPKQIDGSGRWLFYLHGAIVQDQGINAVSKDFGPYKYVDILDTLKSKGFNVINSEW